MSGLMNDPYHRVHYDLAQKLLPAVIFSDDLADVFQALMSGGAQEVLLECWNHLAGDWIAGGDDSVRTTLTIDASAFEFYIARAEDEETMVLVLGMPPVRCSLQSSHIALVLRVNPVTDDLDVRYFTCEAPVTGSKWWVLGERDEEGAHINHGGIDTSGAGQPDYVEVFEAVAACVGLGDLVLLDEDDLDEASEAFDDEDDSDLDGDELDAALEELTLATTWSSPSAEIAAEFLMVVGIVAAAGGAALVLSSERATGLGTEVPTYFQSMAMPNGDLRLEARADYAYWGVDVPVASVASLLTAGFEEPTSAAPNYWGQLPVDMSDDEKLRVVTRMLDGFIAVLQPTGPIGVRAF